MSKLVERLQKFLQHPGMFGIEGQLMWDKLSPYDINTIANSILLLSYNKTFCEFFGREKLLLEGIVHEFNSMKERLDEAKYNPVFFNAVYGIHFISMPSAPPLAKTQWKSRAVSGL